jgi:hypothetical protein
MAAEREYPAGRYLLNLIWLRVCGPGRVVIDSACGPAEDARTADRESSPPASAGMLLPPRRRRRMNQYPCHYRRQSSDPGRT